MLNISMACKFLFTAWGMSPHHYTSDGLSNITERHPELNVIDLGSSSFSHNFKPVNESGVEVALRLIESRPDRSITYVTLGPMTNLAQLLRDHRETVVNKIGRVISMAGALDVPGNTSSVAECEQSVVSVAQSH
jgi:inosine-uridine nucleoside N-ribohydrolase